MNDFAHVRSVEWRRAKGRNDPSYMSTRTRKKLYGQFARFSLNTPQGQLLAAISAQREASFEATPLGQHDDARLSGAPVCGETGVFTDDEPPPPSRAPKPFHVPTRSHHTADREVNIDAAVVHAQHELAETDGSGWSDEWAKVAQDAEAARAEEAGYFGGMQERLRSNLASMHEYVVGAEDDDDDAQEVDDATALSEDEFVRFLAAVLPDCDDAEERGRRIFYELQNPETGHVDFQSFAHWVEEGESEEAIQLEQSSDASFYAGIARAATSMTRPLSQTIVYGMQLVANKVSLAVAKYMANPARLFRRAAIGTLEVVSKRNSSMSIAAAVNAELAQNGWYGVVRLTSGPYVFNAMVSLVMFQTYQSVREKWTFEREGGDPFRQTIKRELFAGTVAGTVQALMNTPVYNVKRALPGMPLADGVRQMFIRRGVSGVFENLPLMVFQEAFGLALFFSSYEYYKAVFEGYLDESQRMMSLVFAGMLAGMTLTTVTHPIDNLHEWHTNTRHCPRYHHNALIHFIRAFHHRSFHRKRRMLFKGLARRVPLGIPAGIPLLVYELMIGHEAVSHSVNEHNKGVAES